MISNIDRLFTNIQLPTIIVPDYVTPFTSRLSPDRSCGIILRDLPSDNNIIDGTIWYRKSVKSSVDIVLQNVIALYCYFISQVGTDYCATRCKKIAMSRHEI